MNKFERKLKGYYRYKKRLKNYGLKEEDGHYYLKTSGKPCSCWLCKNKKYNRKIKHKNQNEEI